MSFNVLIYYVLCYTLYSRSNKQKKEEDQQSLIQLWRQLKEGKGGISKNKNQRPIQTQPLLNLTQCCNLFRISYVYGILFMASQLLCMAFCLWSVVYGQDIIFGSLQVIEVVCRSCMTSLFAYFCLCLSLLCMNIIEEVIYL